MHVAPLRVNCRMIRLACVVGRAVAGADQGRTAVIRNANWASRRAADHKWTPHRRDAQRRWTWSASAGQLDVTQMVTDGYAKHIARCGPRSTDTVRTSDTMSGIHCGLKVKIRARRCMSSIGMSAGICVRTTVPLFRIWPASPGWTSRDSFGGASGRLAMAQYGLKSPGQHD